MGGQGRNRPLFGPAGRLERGAHQRDRAECLRGRGGGAGMRTRRATTRVPTRRRTAMARRRTRLTNRFRSSRRRRTRCSSARTPWSTVSADLQGTLRPDHQVVFFVNGNRKPASGLSTEPHRPRSRHVFPAREHPRPERRPGDHEPADAVPRARALDQFSAESAGPEAAAEAHAQARPSRRQSPPATSRRPSAGVARWRVTLHQPRRPTPPPSSTSSPRRSSSWMRARMSSR